MASFKVSRCYGVSIENTKFSFEQLFLRQIFAGDKPNQLVVIEREKDDHFGETAVNNWGIFDGRGDGAKLVALAQGLHTKAGNFYNSFVMQFEIARFKGSTLEVMGPSIRGETKGQWAIVGGTGKFAMARGVVEKEFVENINGTEVQKLTINGFYYTEVSALEKTAPWGENTGGTPREITGISQHLQSLTIQIDDGTRGVNTIAFTYIDENGRTRAAGPWGPAVGTGHKINFGPSEFVTKIGGTYWKRGKTGFTSLKVITNVQEYGPFGVPENGDTPFVIDMPADKTVVGFFATSDRFLNSFGAYVA